MATSRADFQAEEKQNCPICLGDFKTPRQLPCMHSFCEKCLQDYLSSQEEKLKKLEQIKCPICRQDVGISEQGKPGPSLAFLFPINMILQSILYDSKVKVDQPCDACHFAGISNQAQDICVVCEEAMCKNCSSVHRNQKFSRNHVIISVEEFASNPQNVMKFAKGFSCPEHDGEAIDFYCKDHKTACCNKCCIVSHRNCANVSDLNKELPNLLQEMNSDIVIEQMKKIETHLIKFTEVNESDISLLESQVNNFPSQIRDLRIKINDVLDELERRVKMEGHRICKEEIIRKQEENHHCQSLINSIRNSHTLLETVKKYGTETQVFLMTKKMMSQLTPYVNQVQEKYTKMETTTVQLEVNPQIQSILSTGPDSLAMIINRKEFQNLPVPDIRKLSRDCLVQKNRIIEIKGKDDLPPSYSGVTYLYSGHVMLADFPNKRMCLLDSSYNSVISYTLPDLVYDICVVDNDDEVAVTLPTLQTIQFLSVRNGKITPTRKITTRYRCHGAAAAGKGKIVISGDCDDGGKHYWSLISSGGKEESCHHFHCQCPISYTNVVLDSSFTRVFITVSKAHSLYCFDLSGSQQFIYHHDSLISPCGVATDKYENVYIVGLHSDNIHQLTPDGFLLQIISDGVPAEPQAICFTRDGDEFLVVNYSDSRKIYQFRLQ